MPFRMSDLHRHVMQAAILEDRSFGSAYRRAVEMERNGYRLKRWIKKDGPLRARLEQAIGDRSA